MHESAMGVQAWGDSDSDRGVGGGEGGDWGGRGEGMKGVRGRVGGEGEATLISTYASDGIFLQ